MLEFLFGFIERNIFFIFLCVLALGIASAYSKGIKFLFLSILGISAMYFALLCFYRLGYGIELLYNWSCKYVIRICYFIDYYSFLCLNHSIFLTKIMDYFLIHSNGNLLFYFIHFTVLLGFLILAIEIIIPKIKFIYVQKIKINMKEINKKPYFYNTINRVQSKFILNSVFRC